ncbi:MAG: ABC transporter ATP-binding protein [Planctomycetota bacterium]|nr:ABC transporter ATP-binding protein [Planctomycetota bacterium]
MDTSLIQLNHATRLYGKVIGVNDLNVELPLGAYGLVGPNGAGKSTLIGLITGALRPTLGSVRVFGIDPYDKPQVLKDVGLCPASDILLPGVTARRWLEQLLALSGWNPRDAAQRTREVLDLVGLTEDMNRPINTYSLGMRQRCKLAQALSNEPQLLILDEPFNGLDPIGRRQMTDVLVQWANSGKSLLLASHVLHEVEQVTDSFILIYGGRLLASGTAGELRSMLADLPQELTITSPKVRELASRLANEIWVESVRLEHATNRVTVAVHKPFELYRSLAEWACNDGIEIHQLIGAEGDMQSLFKLLVSRHRGSTLTQSSPPSVSRW